MLSQKDAIAMEEDLLQVIDSIYKSHTLGDVGIERISQITIKINETLTFFRQDFDKIMDKYLKLSIEERNIPRGLQMEKKCKDKLKSCVRIKSLKKKWINWIDEELSYI